MDDIFHTLVPRLSENRWKESSSPLPIFSIVGKFLEHSGNRPAASVLPQVLLPEPVNVMFPQLKTSSFHNQLPPILPEVSMEGLYATSRVNKRNGWGRMAGKCSTVPEDLNSAMSAKGATFRIEKGRERTRSQHDKRVWMYVVSASKNVFSEFLLRKSSSPHSSLWVFTWQMVQLLLSRHMSCCGEWFSEGHKRALLSLLQFQLQRK